MASTTVKASPVGWRAAAELAARRLAAITAVGALLGLVVGGVGGRLAMMLLARLNPEAVGTTSDDGFRIGQFTAADTVGLLLIGTGFGIVGAGIYAVVRGLMLGPRWFQVLSVAGGPAVVVGAAIVHTDGVDFRLLGPVWLTVGLFVAIPGVYAALLTLAAEGLLDEDGWAARAPFPVAVLPLALWIPLAPVLSILIALWAAREALRRTPRGAHVLGQPVLRWAARLGLATVFVLGLADLGRDAADLL